jgi:hypothetical protein
MCVYFISLYKYPFKGDKNFREVLCFPSFNYIMSFIVATTLSTVVFNLIKQDLVTRARIFSHFMCVEKTSGLTKTCACLWSPLVSLGFLYVTLPLCLPQ